MGYLIQIRRFAQKQLDEFGASEFSRVALAISALGNNPRPVRAKKLAGTEFWRVRVGRYRVVYAIDDDTRMITVVRVAKRDEATYHGLGIK